MKIVQDAPWKHVKCGNCHTGLEIELSDIRVVSDRVLDQDEGYINVEKPVVTCPICHKDINLEWMSVPKSVMEHKPSNEYVDDSAY